MRPSSPATVIDGFLGFLEPDAPDDPEEPEDPEDLEDPDEPEDPEDPDEPEGGVAPPPLAARTSPRCAGCPCGAEVSGTGVIAGPVTNGSLRRRAPPCLPRTSTGAAAALLGHKTITSRANRLLRTDAMLHSPDSSCRAEEEAYA